MKTMLAAFAVSGLILIAPAQASGGCWDWVYDVLPGPCKGWDALVDHHKKLEEVGELLKHRPHSSSLMKHGVFTGQLPQ